METALACNEHAFIIGQGVDDHKALFGTTAGLVERFGAERVMDTPLAEEGIMGIAIGAALNGMYPILTHIRADFMLVATNQIINLAAKYRYMFGGCFEVPLLIRAIVGRSWGQGAQHSQSLQSLFAHIPGLHVVMPANSGTILDTYPHIFSKIKGPVISFEHRLLYNLDFNVEPAEPIADPMAARLVRRGRDVTIVATSIMVLEATRAAHHLESQGIECEVIDLHCVSHVDAGRIIESLERTGRLVIADTSWPAYGVAAEICRVVCEHGPHLLRAPVRSLGMAPAPCPTAKALEDRYYPGLDDLCDVVAQVVTGRPDHGIALPGEQSMADVYKRFRGPF
jgi:Pyruvate/2-oxoglutarate dehydrogenase complex, dehydrogenase (E1) component, eukaryotic type, beta subunit